jgi:uncharacterized protein (TIGR02996 family)
MTPEDAFLADIVSQPDDNVPRLIYADWLQDQADPVRAARGEFIRAQIECERLQTQGDTSDTWARLAARSQELLARHQRQWLGKPCSPRLRWVFRRGFLVGMGDETLWEQDTPGYRYLARFYDDGVVVSDSATAPMNELWDSFHRRTEHHGRGPYTFWWTPRAVLVKFHAVSSSGQVDYEGTIVGRTMRLKWYSHINNAKGEEVYKARLRDGS